jgi:electron transport complex protein RnfA
VIFSFASGVGFALALVLLSGIRERLDLVRVPRALKGTPIALILAGLMSLAFFAFKGMIS